MILGASVLVIGCDQNGVLKRPSATEPTDDPAAYQNAPFGLTPIRATFAAPVTTYTVSIVAGPQLPDSRITFYWTISATCGVFTPGPKVGYQSTATWSHPDSDFDPGACPAEPQHPGVISVVATVNAYPQICRAIYSGGSLPGTGAPPGPCR